MRRAAVLALVVLVVFAGVRLAHGVHYRQTCEQLNSSSAVAVDCGPFLWTGVRHGWDW